MKKKTIALFVLIGLVIFVLFPGVSKQKIPGIDCGFDAGRVDVGIESEQDCLEGRTVTEIKLGTPYTWFEYNSNLSSQKIDEMKLLFDIWIAAGATFIMLIIYTNVRKKK